MKVLILDDEANIGMLIGEWISLYCSFAIIFQQIGPALRYLENNEVDAVISDYYIENDGMNGLEFIQKAKSIQPHIISVLMTGSVKVEKTDDSPFDYLWAKPFDHEDKNGNPLDIEDYVKKLLLT